MDLFEIQPESDLQKTFHQQFHKRVSIQDNQHNYKIFGFNKCFTKSKLIETIRMQKSIQEFCNTISINRSI
ncbi:unnamed protein product (macronuclear) [Paramecium tetraurelia]|uniref:Uncharacterized protein n=1 Tax=Paramecium tetraurelia TaxID=5888 RepID=A0CX27_PARTE|nr:uncharacterized protein GSPATT00001547001 [Paramecium tetraurelia]CAK75344.1 unnamed protein product [Paramecium tetraurelia]|eukprot:XP_001442741.1 hypothetical protein (macronuclear) [Paramecium tetraurelia strain d4-2]